jgi:hypothetical protein
MKRDEPTLMNQMSYDLIKKSIRKSNKNFFKSSLAKTK